MEWSIWYAITFASPSLTLRLRGISYGIKNVDVYSWGEGYDDLIVSHGARLTLMTCQGAGASMFSLHRGHVCSQLFAGLLYVSPSDAEDVDGVTVFDLGSLGKYATAQYPVRLYAHIKRLGSSDTDSRAASGSSTVPLKPGWHLCFPTPLPWIPSVVTPAIGFQ